MAHALAPSEAALEGVAVVQGVTLPVAALESDRKDVSEPCALGVEQPDAENVPPLDGDALTDGVRGALGVSVPVAHLEATPETEELDELDAARDGEELPLALRVALWVKEGEEDALHEATGLRDELALSVPLADAEGDRSAEAAADGDTETDAVNVTFAGDAVVRTVSVAESDVEGDAEGLPVLDADASGDALPDLLRTPVAVEHNVERADTVSVTVCETLPVLDAHAVLRAEGEAHAETAGEADSLGELLLLPVELLHADAEGVREAVPQGVADFESEGVAVPQEVAVAHADATGDCDCV